MVLVASLAQSLIYDESHLSETSLAKLRFSKAITSIICTRVHSSIYSILCNFHYVMGPSIVMHGMFG